MKANLNPNLEENLANLEQPIPSSASDFSATHTSKTRKSIVGVLVALVILVTMGYWAYANFFVGPEAVLLKAIQGTIGVDSVRVTMDVPEANISLEAKIHSDENAFSEFLIVYEGEEMGKDVSLELKIITSREDVYTQMDYSLMDKILEDLILVMPEITSMQTYSLLRPVLTGGFWLHFDNSQANKDDGGDDIHLSEEEEKLMKKFRSAIIYNKFDRNYKMDGEKYRRVTIGLDKEKLLEVIDLFKDLDVDIKLSQINAFRQAIADIDDWDKDLIEVLINSQGKLSQVKLFLPEISEEAIQDAIKTSMEDGDGSLVTTGGAFGATQLGSFFTKLISSEEESNLSHVFTMNFDQYNGVKEVKQPGSVVEFDTILQYAQVELMPFVYQYMMMQQPQLDALPSVSPGVGSGYPGMPSLP